MSDSQAGNAGSPDRDYEQICREFEAALRAGNHPDPKALLERVPEDERPALLSRLLEVQRAITGEGEPSGHATSSIELRPEGASDPMDDLPLYESTLDSPPTQSSTKNGTLRPGAWIGRYQLKLRLGVGGFGEVWQAHDPVLDREVALKTLRQDKPHQPEFNKNLVQEGQKLAKLSHPAIVRVLDAGEDDGRAFLVSELKLGGTLHDKLRGTPRIPPVTAVEWVIQIATAVQFAHERGFVHRDLKPGNILFDTENQLYVCDFGISASELEQLAEEPAMVGTLGYMSPEQAMGNARLAGPTSDVYSIGAILYTLLVGRLPFVARSPIEYREQILNRQPRSLRSLNSQIPQQLEDICLQCLSKEPGERPASAQALAEQLQAWLQSDAPKSLAASRAGTRNRVVVGLVAALLLVGVTVWLAISRFSPEGVASAVEADQSLSNRAASALPAVATERPAWTHPEVICWSPHNELSEQHGFVPARKQYLFETSGVSLFQCGESDGSALRMQAEFHIHGEEGLGTGGFFWSLNPSDGRNGMPSCWAIQVGRASTQSEYGVAIRKYDVGPGTGRAVVTRNRFVSNVPLRVAKLSSFHLEIEVSATRIDRIALNGQELIEEPLVLEEYDWNLFDAGGFGFTGKNGAIAVSDFVAEKVVE